VTPIPATQDDAEELGAMHVQAWRETYAGLVPQHVLDALDAAARARMWRSIVATDRQVFIVRDAGTIVGFGACGPPRDEGLTAFAGEIGALYILRRAQRRGFGRVLMHALAHALDAEGRNNAALWVLHGNTPAQRFYEALGGRMVTERTRTRDDWTLREIAYAWDDVTQLFFQRP
jgi:ribosomal protein S18 acetylase RimI-like enzyme